MKQAKPKISIDKSVFTLNINGKKLSLSLEELRVLHSVIGSKIGSFSSIPYNPFYGSTTLAMTNGNVLADSVTSANITLGEENE